MGPVDSLRQRSHLSRLFLHNLRHCAWLYTADYLYRSTSTWTLDPLCDQQSIVNGTFFYVPTPTSRAPSWPSSTSSIEFIRWTSSSCSTSIYGIIDAGYLHIPTPTTRHSTPYRQEIPTHKTPSISTTIDQDIHIRLWRSPPTPIWLADGPISIQDPEDAGQHQEDLSTACTSRTSSNVDNNLTNTSQWPTAAPHIEGTHPGLVPVNFLLHRHAGLNPTVHLIENDHLLPHLRAPSHVADNLDITPRPDPDHLYTLYNHSTSTCPLTSSSTSFCASPSQSPTDSFTWTSPNVADPFAEIEPDAIETEINMALWNSEAAPDNVTLSPFDLDNLASRALRYLLILTNQTKTKLTTCPQSPRREDQKNPRLHRYPPDRVAQRFSGGSTEDTDQEGAYSPIRIPDFARSTSWLVDYQDADKHYSNAHRSYHLDTNWTSKQPWPNRTYEEFLDAMYQQLIVSTLPHVHQVQNPYQSWQRDDRKHRQMLRMWASSSGTSCKTRQGILHRGSQPPDHRHPYRTPGETTIRQRRQQQICYFSPNWLGSCRKNTGWWRHQARGLESQRWQHPQPVFLLWLFWLLLRTCYFLYVNWTGCQHLQLQDSTRSARANFQQVW